MAEIAARAGIHRRDQLEARGEIGLPCRARNGDVARLERFAQYLQYFSIEFRKLIEEKDAVMGERYFSGTGRTAAVNSTKNGDCQLEISSTYAII
jgi:hypothetical protein